MLATLDTSVKKDLDWLGMHLSTVIKAYASGW